MIRFKKHATMGLDIAELKQPGANTHTSATWGKRTKKAVNMPEFASLPGEPATPAAAVAAVALAARILAAKRHA